MVLSVTMVKQLVPPGSMAELTKGTVEISTLSGSGPTGVSPGRSSLVAIPDVLDAFVHEGITTGLKGGRLLLDGDDFETIRDSMTSRTLVSSSQTYQSASKMAVAPINLAVSRSLLRSLDSS
jgi:hypothetical protein